MSSVYVVNEGEIYEGSHIIKIFSTYEKALNFVENFIKTSSFYVHYKKADDIWEDGCSYIEINKYEVF